MYLILGVMSALLIAIVINQHEIISNQKYIIALSQKISVKTKAFED
jgi:hypothetical protein